MKLTVRKLFIDGKRLLSPVTGITYCSLKHSFSAMVFIFLFFLSGCSLIISSASSDLMSHLSATILNNDDLKLVEDGAPSYLLMIDSLISKDPENQDMLTTASLLYSAYSNLFVKDIERSKKMANKALDYASRAACLHDRQTCGIRSTSYEQFVDIIKRVEKQHVPTLFALGNAWARWIMANRSDFDAIADISRIELIMQKVVELDETYRDGSAYLYLGTLATILPPAAGGKPEQAKRYYIKALELSKGKNLMVKVMYAKSYARMIFDKELHDQLLTEVIESDPYVPGNTLINTWAQKQAKELLSSGEDYF